MHNTKEMKIVVGNVVITKEMKIGVGNVVLIKVKRKIRKRGASECWKNCSKVITTSSCEQQSHTFSDQFSIYIHSKCTGTWKNQKVNPRTQARRN